MMKKIDPWLGMTLLLAALAKIVLLFRPFHPWWDFGVYLGMGKFLFSAGTQGLFEPIRPLLWPFILGLFWKLGISSVLLFRMIGIACSLGIIILTYCIALALWNRRAAQISSMLVAFSSIIFFMSMRIYTEIPAVFLVLLSLYLLIRKKPAASGIALGLAIMTKFTAGIFIFPFLLWNRKKPIPFIFGLSVIGIPYAAYNLLAFGNPFYSVMAASEIIGKVLTCNVLHYNPWYFYIIRLFSDNIFFIFTIPGILFSMKPKKMVVAFSFLLPFIYLISLHCRIYRYLVMIIPFAAILSGSAISSFLKTSSDKAWRIFLFVVLLTSCAITMAYYIAEDQVLENHASIEYYGFAAGFDEIHSSNPLHAMYSDARINMVYYPIFDEDLAEQLYASVESGVSPIFLDDCGGGIICPDEACRSVLDRTYEKLGQDYHRPFYRTSGRCTYSVFIRWE